ncbi:MAG: ABC transporter permease [Candidatus Paceibacterota bacterium]
MKITKELNGALTLALRDFIKFRRDKIRIITSLIFPVLFIAVLGGSLQANIGKDAGYNFIVFTFTGVIGQTLFQSTASGIISLIEDRENDFAQEIFVSPISRYTIIIGKILGETLVSYAQVIGIFTLGLLLTIPLGLTQLSSMIIAGLACTFLGGAFGVLVLANLGSQRSANQIFPFLIFPQFFLAGVFNPIKELPQALFILSRLAPMT